MRPHNLPVIILRALIDCLHRLSIRRQTEQIELAIAVQIRGVKNEGRPGWLVQQHKLLLLIAEPDQRSARALAGNLRRRRQEQIERSVIVEISDSQPHFACKVVGRIRYSGNLSCVPALPFVLIRNPTDNTVTLHD